MVSFSWLQASDSVGSRAALGSEELWLVGVMVPALHAPPPARPSEGPVCWGVLFNGTDTGSGALDEARRACLDQCIDNIDEPGDEYLGLVVPSFSLC